MKNLKLEIIIAVGRKSLLIASAIKRRSSLSCLLERGGREGRGREIINYNMLHGDINLIV